MKKKNLWIIALVAIITLALIGCGGEDNPAPETFTVTFIANGGTPEPQAKTVEKGSKVNEPSITKANSTLDGWYTESAFSTKWNFATDTVTANIDLHAKWLCNCPNGEHLGIGETCDCGGTNCNCTLKVYGTVAGIPIYRSGEVSDEQMAEAVASALIGYEGLNIGQKNALVGKIDAIHIGIATVANAYKMKDGRKVLYYRYTRNVSQINNLFDDIGSGDMQITQE